MKDFERRIDKVQESMRKTTDPAEKQRLEYIMEEIKADYRTAIECGLIGEE